MRFYWRRGRTVADLTVITSLATPMLFLASLADVPSLAKCLPVFVHAVCVLLLGGGGGAHMKASMSGRVMVIIRVSRIDCIGVAAVLLPLPPHHRWEHLTIQAVRVTFLLAILVWSHNRSCIPCGSSCSQQFSRWTEPACVNWGVGWGGPCNC